MDLDLGNYSSALAAAVTYDLAARILAEDDLNFTNEEFARLLPALADQVIEGLSPDLPTNLRKEMVSFAREALRRQGRARPCRGDRVVRLADLGHGAGRSRRRRP